MFWTSLIVILTGTWFCVHNISAFPSWQNNILQQAASTVYDDKNDSGVNTYRRDVQREGNNSSASVKASNSSINHDSSITKTPISQVSKGIGGSKNNNSSRNVSATSLPKAKEIPSNVTKLSVKEENATTTLRNSTAAKIGTTSPQNSTKNTEKPDNVDTTEAISTPSPSPVPTTPMPELLHVPWEKVCHTKFRGEDMKILPVFMVGWGLENDCDQFVPLDRFKMDKYANRKPKFDIPGLNIPLVCFTQISDAGFRKSENISSTCKSSTRYEFQMKMIAVKGFMTRMSVKIADDEDDCTQGIHDWYECENEGK